MRIVSVTASFPKLSETFLVSKFIGLLDMGWDVHIVCFENNAVQWQGYPLLSKPEIKKRVHGVWPHRPRWLAVALIPLLFFYSCLQNPSGTFRYLKNAIKQFGWLQAMRRFYLDSSIIALRPDIVHFEFGSLAVEQVDMGRLLNCKAVVSFRGYDLNFAGLGQSDYYAKVWKYADALHLLGQDLWKRAQTRGCPPDKLHVLIPPALDLDRFMPKEKDYSTNMGTHKYPLYILSVGRLEWKKGYEYAFQAVRLLIDSGIHCEWKIIGSGSYLETLAFARHELKLSEHVEFFGGLPHQRVLEELDNADIFLHAAVSEGFCNAVLEAQAMQVPVVCTDADGLSENVIDGQTGYVVPSRDASALAEKMLLLARDPSLRQSFGKAGRKRVIENFQLADQLAKFDELYRMVMAK